MESSHESGRMPAAAHLRDYWKIVWQSRYTVLTILVLVVAVAVLRVSLATPVYQATAVIEIKPEARQILPGQQQWLGAESRSWIAEELYFNTQLEVLRSRDLAEHVFDELRLDESPEFAAATDPVGAFAARVEVRPKVNTRLVELGITSADPAAATQWVNALADSYVERNVEQAKESFAEVMDGIQLSMRDLGTDLRDTEMAALGDAAELELFIPEDQQEILRKNLETYNRELATIQARMAALEAEIEAVDRIRRQGGDQTSLIRFSQDPVIRSLYADRLAIDKELERLASEGKRDRHPEHIATRSQLDTISEKLNERIVQLGDQLREDYRLAKSNAAKLGEEIRRTEQRALSVQQATTEFDLRRSDTESRRRVYDVVTETMQQLQLGAQLISMNNNVAVLDHAIEPRRPVRPRKLLTVAFGTFLGLLFGVGTVLFLDYLDNTLRTPEEIEQHLGINVLAIVPKFRDPTANAVREAYQSLRTSILFSSGNVDKRVLLFTSAGPREGKSSTAYNVAKGLASAGDRVCLVDCDLRRPTVDKHAGIEREPGLTNYLLQGIEGAFEPFARQSDSSNLWVIPSGPIPPNPTELVGSAKFRLLLTQLKASYDWVVVDSPPVASLADTVVLATLVDMIVLVIKHNENDRDLIRRCVKRLRDVKADIAGAVLNAMSVQRSYDYYAAYQYYASDEGEERGWRGRRRRGAGGPDKRVAL